MPKMNDFIDAAQKSKRFWSCNSENGNSFLAARGGKFPGSAGATSEIN